MGRGPLRSRAKVRCGGGCLALGRPPALRRREPRTAAAQTLLASRARWAHRRRQRPRAPHILSHDSSFHCIAHHTGSAAGLDHSCSRACCTAALAVRLYAFALQALRTAGSAVPLVAVARTLPAAAAQPTVAMALTPSKTGVAEANRQLSEMFRQMQVRAQAAAAQTGPERRSERAEKGRRWKSGDQWRRPPASPPSDSAPSQPWREKEGRMRTECAALAVRKADQRESSGRQERGKLGAKNVAHCCFSSFCSPPRSSLAASPPPHQPRLPCATAGAGRVVQDDHRGEGPRAGAAPPGGG